MRVVLQGPLRELPIEGKIIELNTSQVIGLILAGGVVHINDTGTRELFEEVLYALHLEGKPEPNGISADEVVRGDILVRVTTQGHRLIWEMKFVQ